MDRKRERIYWAGAVVLTALCGTLVGKKPPATAPVAEQARNAKKDGRDSTRTERAAQPAPRDEADLRRLANHALSAPNRTERFQRLMILLDNTTAENWNTLWKEYIRQTLEEGRIHETEWSLFMSRVGEVAGPDAMEYFAHHGQEQYTFNRREVLKGWAAKDPKGALTWLEGQPETDQPAEFWGAVMSGAAANDSKLATELLARIPSGISPGVVRSTADTLIQSEGLGNTIHLLEDMVAVIPPGGAIPPHLTQFYQELKQRSERIKWLAGSYPDMKTRQPSILQLDEKFAPGPANPLEEIEQ
ncbi:MAG: hypothetical protein ABIS50_10950 [Luteolibacter sp.]|uniref:hypothetical protein n=1 Tax=Luteolibacter sp. TaxID=1962973 RepID=UPI003267A3F6